MNNLSQLIKGEASRLGFDLCGIAAARPLAERALILSKWCSEGMNHVMKYLERNIDVRTDPEKYFDGARSVVATGINYYSPFSQKDSNAPVLSRYTYGRDYHKVISEKLSLLLDFIQKNEPGIRGRITVDTAPVLEKAWAVEAGLGWQGKNTVVINKEIGSFFFIGLILLDREMEYDAPADKDFCGDCTKCITECPTGAINEDRTIDARLCMANLNLEKRGPLPASVIPIAGKRIFGCDRCQEVCPWNSKCVPCTTPDFKLNDEVASMTAIEWINLSYKDFVRLFGHTPMGRIDYEQLKNNIKLFYEEAS